MSICVHSDFWVHFMYVFSQFCVLFRSIIGLILFNLHTYTFIMYSRIWKWKKPWYIADTKTLQYCSSRLHLTSSHCLSLWAQKCWKPFSPNGTAWLSEKRSLCLGNCRLFYRPTKLRVSDCLRTSFVNAKLFSYL